MGFSWGGRPLGNCSVGFIMVDENLELMITKWIKLNIWLVHYRCAKVQVVGCCQFVVRCFIIVVAAVVCNRDDNH